MHHAHQELAFRRGAMGRGSVRFWWGIGLVLLVGAWPFTEAWALTVSPTAMTFQTVQGVTNPPSQRVTLSKSSLRHSNWTATDNAAWLTISPGVGSMARTATIAIAVKTTGLVAGTYSALVTIKVDKGESATFPVMLKVAPSATTSSLSMPTPGTDTSAMASHTWNPVTSTNLAGDERVVAPVAISNSSPSTPMTGAGAMASRTWNPFSGTSQMGGKPTVAPATTTSSTPTSITSSSPSITSNPGPSTSSSTPISVTHTSTTASLTWSPVTSTNLAGYKVYMGTASGLYGTPLDVGNVTSYVMSNLAIGNTYYFVVTSYNSSGSESLPSTEVSKSIY